jgi:hypothetical protein
MSSIYFSCAPSHPFSTINTVGVPSTLLQQNRINKKYLRPRSGPFRFLLLTHIQHPKHNFSTSPESHIPTSSAKSNQIKSNQIKVTTPPKNNHATSPPPLPRPFPPPHPPLLLNHLLMDRPRPPSHEAHPSANPATPRPPLPHPLHSTRARHRSQHPPLLLATALGVPTRATRSSREAHLQVPLRSRQNALGVFRLRHEILQ